MYLVKFTTRAAKELKKLPGVVQKRILESLELLRINPFAEIIQYKKLRLREDLFRIRIGDYRVVYEVHNQTLIIVVVRVGHRKDVYRELKLR